MKSRLVSATLLLPTLLLVSCGSPEQDCDCEVDEVVETGLNEESVTREDAPQSVEMFGETLDLQEDNPFTQYAIWVYKGRHTINGKTYDIFVDEKAKAYAIGCMDWNNAVWYDGEPCPPPPPPA